MSADNWAVCPQCIAVLKSVHKRQLAIAADNYGKVPVDDYLALVATAKATGLELTHRPPETFREDYAIGLQGSLEKGYEFIVSYSGGCPVCGLSHEFKHTGLLTFDPSKLTPKTIGKILKGTE